MIPDHGPVAGSFTTHTIERGRDKPINCIRRLLGRLPVYHTYIEFKPKHDITIGPGETVEFRFFESGDVELIRKPTDDG